MLDFFFERGICPFSPVQSYIHLPKTGLKLAGASWQWHWKEKFKFFLFCSQSGMSEWFLAFT